MRRIAVPSVLQQSTVSIGMMIVQAVVNPFGTQALGIDHIASFPIRLCGFRFDTNNAGFMSSLDIRYFLR